MAAAAAGRCGLCYKAAVASFYIAITCLSSFFFFLGREQRTK
jgi:hypothetical protein